MSATINYQAREVRHIREQLGYNRTALGRELGVTYATVRRWESGIAKPQPGHLERLRRMAEKKLAAEPQA